MGLCPPVWPPSSLGSQWLQHILSAFPSQAQASTLPEVSGPLWCQVMLLESGPTTGSSGWPLCLVGPLEVSSTTSSSGNEGRKWRVARKFTKLRQSTMLHSHHQ